jgi:plastocyanin
MRSTGCRSLAGGASVGLRVLMAFGAVTSAALLLSACAAGSDTSGDPLTIGGASETVVIEDFKFQPGNLQVPAGAEITFVNRDSAVHDAKARDETWETEHLGEDEEDAVAFDTAGTYDYFCSLHPAMKARISVLSEPGT